MNDGVLALERKLAECEAKLARVIEHSRNHAETLRGIAAMDPATESERMVQWARDGLSGYVETVEATVKNLMDAMIKAEERAEAAESALAALRARVESGWTVWVQMYGDTPNFNNVLIRDPHRSDFNRAKIVLEEGESDGGEAD